MNLVPCPTCDRHVKASDSACPFCASNMPERGTITSPLRTLGTRAAMFFGASAVVVACGGETKCANEEGCTSSSSSSSSSSSTSGAAVYGAPVYDDAGPDASPNDAGAPDAKMVDASVVDATMDAPFAAYGAPGP